MKTAVFSAAVSVVLGLTLAGCTNPVGSASEAPSSPPSATVTPNNSSLTASPSPSQDAVAAPIPSPSPASVVTTEAPVAAVEPTQAPAPAPVRKAATEMTPEEAMHAAVNGEITLEEYCTRDIFYTSGDTQMCYAHNHPPVDMPLNNGVSLWGDTPPQYDFTYDEAYAAWQNGMPYYDAFCLNYAPTTAGGLAQCTGIHNGTVDGVTGEYIGG